MLRAYSDASDPAPLTRDLGRVFHLQGTAIKPYSCCGSTHAYVDAALALRRRLGAPWDQTRPVRVGTSKVVDVQCGFEYAPTTALNAQMSLRYVVAAALVHGQVLPPQFTPEAICDREVVEVAQRIELVADPALDTLYPEHFAGWVAGGQAGDWVRVDVLDPSGSPAAPIDAAGITEKFRGINPDLPVDAVARGALDIEAHGVSELLHLLAAPGEKQRRTA
jgi:2-methylcitrate dehydratase PrpD